MRKYSAVQTSSTLGIAACVFLLMGTAAASAQNVVTAAPERVGGALTDATSLAGSDIGFRLGLKCAGGSVLTTNADGEFVCTNTIDNATYAATSGTAGTAGYAANAGSAGYATRAGRADYATRAGWADRAGTADNAYFSDYYNTNNYPTTDPAVPAGTLVGLFGPNVSASPGGSNSGPSYGAQYLMSNIAPPFSCSPTAGAPGWCETTTLRCASGYRLVITGTREYEQSYSWASGEQDGSGTYLQSYPTYSCQKT